MNCLSPKKIILIGASTGGPGLIEAIVSGLNKNIEKSIVIAQHMDPLHLASFAKRLQRINDNRVVFVEEKTEICHGTIYILSQTSRIVQEQGKFYLQPLLSKGYYNPTIDELFLSASDLKNIDLEAYILSGIGADGAKGMLALKNVGVKTVAQDEQSSIVYGMPKSAKEIGAAQKILGIDSIVTQIKG